MDLPINNIIPDAFKRSQNESSSQPTNLGIWCRPGTLPMAIDDHLSEAALDLATVISSFATGDPGLGSNPYEVENTAARLADTFQQELRQLSVDTEATLAIASVSGTAKLIAKVADPAPVQPVLEFDVLGDEIHRYDSSKDTLPPKRAQLTALNLAMLERGTVFRDHPVVEPLMGMGQAADELAHGAVGLTHVDPMNLDDRYWALSSTTNQIGDVAQTDLAREITRIVNSATPAMTPEDWGFYLSDPPERPPSGGQPRAVALVPEEYNLVRGQLDNRIRPISLDIQGRVGVLVLHPIDEQWVDTTLREQALAWLYNRIRDGDNAIARVHESMATKYGHDDPIATFEDFVDDHVDIDLDTVAEQEAAPDFSTDGTSDRRSIEHDDLKR